jgi:hypothetical protein
MINEQTSNLLEFARGLTGHRDGWRSTKLHATLPTLKLNVPAIAHKTMAEVDRILGRANKTERIGIGDQQTSTYRSGAVQVVFARGRVSSILLHDARGLTFEPHSLAKLGLRVQRPTSQDATRMRWSNLYRIREVSIFANSRGGVSRVYIDLGSAAA